MARFALGTLWQAAPLLFAAGCVMHPPVVGERGPKARSDAAETAYQVTISKYSDRGEAYDQLDTRVFCAATYQSWVFREARVQRLASFQSQTAEQVLKTLDQERSAFDAYYEFWLGVHVNDLRFDDFDRPNSVWRLVLVTDSMEAQPSQIRRVGRADLNMRAIYPYMDEFWVGYWVRFPRIASNGSPVVMPGTNRIRLRVASTLGRVQMMFPLE